MSRKEVLIYGDEPKDIMEIRYFDGAYKKMFECFAKVLPAMDIIHSATSNLWLVKQSSVIIDLKNYTGARNFFSSFYMEESIHETGAFGIRKYYQLFLFRK